MRALSALSASPLSLWKRLAIVLLAVPAILVGLLAMHVLTTGASHAPASTVQASTVMSDSTTDTLNPHAHETTDCDGLCGPEHDMVGMACILALLMTALLLTVHLTLRRWPAPLALASTVVADLANLAPPQPPSLLVLSISRT